MKENNHIQLISRLAAVLVAILALMAFILSYSSLQHLALTNGVGERLSYAWPLLLDFAMVVFSLAILRANLRVERAWYPWLLTIAFSSLATVANVLDVATLGIPPVAIAAAVKALAPVALVLAFELLMGMIRAEIRRAAVVQSLAELKAQAEQVNATITGLQEQVTEMTAKRDQVQAELTQLRREKRREENQAPAETSPDVIDQAKAILAERVAISGSELGRLLGKSESLGRRLRRELLPIISTNGANHQEDNHATR